MIAFSPSAQRAGRETHQLWVFGDSEELGVTQYSQCKVLLQRKQREEQAWKATEAEAVLLDDLPPPTEKRRSVELKTLPGALVRDGICIELRVNSVRPTGPESPTYVPTVASERKTKFSHGDYKVGEICDCLTLRLEQREQEPVCNCQDEQKRIPTAKVKRCLHGSADMQITKAQNLII